MSFELDPAEIYYDSPLTLADKRPTGLPLPYTETYAIPVTGLVLLREAPERLSLSIPTGVTVIYLGPATPLSEVAGSPSVGQFSVNYTTGVLTFNTGEAGVKVVVFYNGLGSVISAAHVNNINTKLFGDQGGGWSFYAKLDGLSTNGVDFLFPGDVEVTGDVTINGQLNVVGAINRQALEVLETTDDIFLLNANEAIATKVGLEIARGAPAGDNLNPQLVWMEASDTFQFLSTNQTFAAKTPLLKIRDSGGMQLQTIDSTTTPSEVTFASSLGAGDAGTMWYNAVDSQFKGWNGSAIIILG